jgi:signal transduction histidine kinase
MKAGNGEQDSVGGGDGVDRGCYNAFAMFVIKHLDPRRRFLLTYAAIILAGAAVALWVWPGQAWGILAMAALGWVAAWLISTICLRSIRHRVHTIRETAEAISSGDLSRHIESMPHDDFIKLTRALEQLADQLRSSTREQDRLKQQVTRNEKLALVGELAAIVAHEVNNPLDGLQDSVRILRRSGTTTDGTRQLLDMMDAGLYRIEMVVRRLLTMSRDEEVHLLPTRVDEMVNDAALFVRPRLNRYGIEMVCDYPESPLFAHADRNQMSQVLINLMLNAADSMSEGGKLIVRSRLDESRGVVVLELSDTGCGISPDDLPHIFEPFYSTKAKGEGTGLGLSIVSCIIESHEGTIVCDSTPGKGTRFHIELPAAMSSVDADESSPCVDTHGVN